MKLYHGSPRRLDTVRPGSMLTTDPAWAAGYTTSLTSAWREVFVGKVHGLFLRPTNPFMVRADLHGLERFMLDLAPALGWDGRGGLRGAAQALHESGGYDALVSSRRHGAIVLCEFSVEEWLDPVEVLRTALSRGEDIPENLLGALAQHR